jgi:Arc/MetJ-type ribon-helix-helix transcriptional regulator
VLGNGTYRIGVKDIWSPSPRPYDRTPSEIACAPGPSRAGLLGTRAPELDPVVERIADRYAFCMTQLVTRVDPDLVDSIDELVAKGVVESRSDAVRQGLRMLIDQTRRRRTAEAIIAGYALHPQTDHDVPWADGATVQMIADEPW